MMKNNINIADAHSSVIETLDKHKNGSEPTDDEVRMILQAGVAAIASIAIDLRRIADAAEQ